MTSLSRFVRAHPFVVFAVLACLVGWAQYLLSAFGIGLAPDQIPIGPFVAAVIVTSVQGRDVRQAWWRRIRRVRIAGRWLAVVTLVPIVVHVAIVLVNRGFGAPLPTSSQLADWPNIPIVFVAMLVLVGLGEEAGWTAFAIPLLLEKHGLGKSWVLLGAVRTFWHLPLMLTGDMPWFMGIAGNLGFQLLILVVVERSNGNWSQAAVWHAMLNAFGGAFFFGMVTGADNLRLGALLGVAYATMGAVAAGLHFSSECRIRRMADEDSSFGQTPSLVAGRTVGV
jgi:membrane protease YdiL (CAAX protease family)